MAVLCNLGIAYQKLGDVRHAIRFFEQDLEIAREIGDLSGIATVSFNTAILYTQQGELRYALPLAQEAAQAFEKIGHPEYTQQAQALIVQLHQLVGY